MKRRKQTIESDSQIKSLLKASEYFLLNRNFKDCRKYALRASESYPNHPSPAQILAICKVITASKTPEEPNHYAILDIPMFTKDNHIIKTKFTQISSLLNPNKNPFPLASEAFQIALKAWSVLSNPVEKTQFDLALKTKEKDGVGLKIGSFWTMCPYCYYVYEYAEVYEDCYLKCQNVSCRKGFQAAAIDAPPPAPAVAEKGEHCFSGFPPVGKEDNDVQMLTVVSDSLGKNGDDVCEDQFDTNDFLDIDEKSCNGYYEEVKTGDDNGVEAKFKNGDGKEVNQVYETVSNCGNVGRKKIKMVANSSKKFMGKGIRVETSHVPVLSEGSNGANFEVDDGLEFFVGDDDIYVGF